MTAASSRPRSWHRPRDTDLAVLEIYSDKPLPYVEFGDPDDVDPVIAIGNFFRPSVRP